MFAWYQLKFETLTVIGIWVDNEIEVEKGNNQIPQSFSYS